MFSNVSSDICQFNFHGITERFQLEGTSKDHLSQPLYHRQGHLSLDQVFQTQSKLIVNISHDGAQHLVTHQF